MRERERERLKTGDKWAWRGEGRREGGEIGVYFTVCWNE